MGPVWPGPAHPSLIYGLSLSLPYCPASQVCSRAYGTPFCPMALLHPFLLATPPPSGCNSNLTSEKRSCQITLPKVVPFPLFSTSAPKSYFSSAFPSFKCFICLFTCLLPTLIHVCVRHSVMSDSLRPHELVARQASLFMEFSRQEYWSGLPLPSPEDLPDPRIEPWSSTSQADSLPFEL